MSQRIVKLRPDEIFHVRCTSNRGAEEVLRVGGIYEVRRVRENYSTGERAYELADEDVPRLWFLSTAFSRLP